MTSGSQPFFLQALDALKRGDRRAAAALLGRQLREGHTSVKNLPHVAQLAAHIGEVDLAIDAARRGVVPGVVETHIAYWAMLASYGRSDQAIVDLDRQAPSLKDNPVVLHFLGTVASEFGRTEEAERLFRRALAKAPSTVRTWFSLAMLKTFTPNDPDVATMERLVSGHIPEPEARASLHYALGKACEDCGEYDRAFDHYLKGSAIRRMQQPINLDAVRNGVDQAIRDFTPESLMRLTPSTYAGARTLFVTGLPRSGTTLTEQILLGHPRVRDGAELSLLGSAMIPSRGSFAGAIRYQENSELTDPWGEIARDYADLVDKHFRSTELVVDKSLGTSLLTGLTLHAMPQARIAWLRRSPDDVALSCFRTYFTAGLPWTWSLEDIADNMRIEDRLFEHWHALFGDRILVVPYEDLAAQPSEWAVRLQEHFGLPIEAGIEAAPRHGRPVRTASVGQVREPITTSRIGLSKRFERQLRPFRERYYS